MTILMSAAMLVLISCGTGTRDDSKDVAEEQNEEKFEGGAEDDADFAVEAANGGMMEVQLGTLAAAKASSPQVKQFGQMMVEDHSKGNNQLKGLASQKNISLPTAMDDAHQRKYDNLQEKSGDDFDTEYMDLMVKDHKEDIDKFEKEAEDGKDPEVKAWASATVPVLRHHLEEAQRIQDALKADNK